MPAGAEAGYPYEGIDSLSSTGDRQLILITCEVTVNADGSITYNKNHVVTAVPA